MRTLRGLATTRSGMSIDSCPTALPAQVCRATKAPRTLKVLLRWRDALPGWDDVREKHSTTSGSGIDSSKPVLLHECSAAVVKELLTRRQGNVHRLVIRRRRLNSAATSRRT
jgi:hypothetical protein